MRDRIFCAALLWTSSLCLVPSTAEAQYRAEITRTGHGVPHVKASNLGSLGFGAGYAYASDNLCLILEEMMTLRGERSRWLGPDGSGGPETDTGFPSTNRNSDFFQRAFNDQASVDRYWAQQPDDAKQLLTGYVAGINRLLAERLGTKNMPRACADAPWAVPVSTDDVIRLLRRHTAEASIRFRDGIASASPTSGQIAPEIPKTPAYAPMPSLGSNAVAFGRDITRSKRGMLLANPHFPWFGALRLYEIHLTIPGKLDVAGASLSGLPVVSIGFNQHLAWSHTVNTSSHFTIAQLKLDPSRPMHYLVDDEPRPMTFKDVSIDLPRGGSETRRLWSAEFGPIISVPGRFDWSETTAFALQDANADNMRLLPAWMGMNRSRDLAAMTDAMSTTMGIPWVNTIAVDAAGSALYANFSVVPNVSDAQLQSCVPKAFQPNLAQAKFMTIVLDASRSECHWSQAANVAQPGTVPASEMPSLLRSDWVANSNDSAWLVNPASPITARRIVSSADYPQNGRTRIGIAQIEGALAGGHRFSRPDVLAMALNNSSYFGSTLKAAMPEICTGRPDLLRACDIVRRWNGRAALDSEGYALAMEWLRAIKRLPSPWREPFDPARPLDTPYGLDVGDPQKLALFRSTLAEALDRLEKIGIDPARPWGEIQFADGRHGSVGIHGGDADDIYNVIDGLHVEGGKRVGTGTSFLMAVEFTPGGPVAEGLLTYSQSTDPESPFYRDQLDDFSTKQWRRMPFTAAEIRAARVGVPQFIKE